MGSINKSRLAKGLSIETGNLKLIDHRIIDSRGLRLVIVRCSTIETPGDIREYYILDDNEMSLEGVLMCAMERGSKFDDLARTVNYFNT